MKKLLMSILSLTLAFNNFSVVNLYADEIIRVTSTTESKEILKAGVINASDETKTNGQPFASGTAQSSTFRIPGIISAKDKDGKEFLVAVSDARWGGTNDWGGLDTIASVSYDNGKTWQYSFPIYFPDSNRFTDKTLSTVAIDPVVVQDATGTIWVMADMNPTGITTGATYPQSGTGFIEVTKDGVTTKRLALTSNYDKTSINPKDNETDYEYYVGDFNTDGYAPVLKRSDHSESDYWVDAYYNIYYHENNEYVVKDLIQTQVDSDQTIQQNCFYKGSKLHVYNTGYIWAVKSQDGLNWSDPEILNTQIKREDDKETALLVSPGKGLLTSTNDIVVGMYDTYNGENASIIYSSDNGKTWTRSEDVSVTSSENELVELSDGTLRMFYRSNTMHVCYVDWVRSVEDEKVKYTPQTPVDMGIGVSSNCNVTATLLKDTKIDDKDVVLVAMPEGPGSWNRVKGRIFVFTMEANNKMNLEYTYHVNEGDFWYSCMDELANGNIGMLWENSNGTMRYDEFNIKNVLGINRDLNLYIGDVYHEIYKDNIDITTQPSDIVKVSSEVNTNAALYDHISDTNTIAAFSTTPNANIALEDALYTFTSDEENEGSFFIYNDTKGLYLTNDSNADAFFNTTKTSMKVVDSNNKFKIGKNNDTRYVMFYPTQMNFNANTNGSDTDGHLLTLWAKKDTVEIDDLIAGYEVVSEVESGKQYLITYVQGSNVFVLYPTNGKANQTKLLGTLKVYSMFDKQSSEENINISLDNALFKITPNGDNFQMLNISSNKYLQNVVNTNMLTDTACDMTLEKGGKDNTFRLKSASGRYYIFYHNSMKFDMNSKYDANLQDFDLILLEKQAVISEDDYFPGYKLVKDTKDISADKQYLVAYNWDDETNGGLYVMYPGSYAGNNDNCTKRIEPYVSAITYKLTIEALKAGKTTMVINERIYNINVLQDPQDSSKDLPLDVLSATQGSYQPNNAKEGLASLAIDNDTTTLWHSNYGGANREDLWMQLNINGNYDVNGLRYLGRASKINGNITKYEIRVSNDEDFATYEVVASGNWADDGKWKYVEFDKTVEHCKYVRLYAIESHSNNASLNFAAAVEVRLTGALSTTPAPVDKNALVKLITTAKAIKTEDKTSASVKVLKDAIEIGELVNEDPNASEDDVKQAITKLQKAIDALVTKADRTTLVALINEAKAIKTEDKTSASVKVLKDAIEIGELVNNNEEASEQDIRQAINTLQHAIDSLVTKGDKTALAKAIADAKAVDTNNKTDESKAVLASAITSAEMIYANEDASEEDVNKAINALDEAIKALEDKPFEATNLINTEANKDKVKVVTTSSQCGVEGSADEKEGLGTAAATLDYVETTYWHTNWNDASVKCPQYITYDLGATYDLDEIRFLPRQGSQWPNGDIFQVKIYVSSDKEFNENELVGTYDFENDGKYLLDRSWHKITLEASGRYVKFLVTKSGGDTKVDTFVSMAEIRFYGDENNNVAPNLDKVALVKAIEEAKAIDTTNKTDDSKTGLENAIKHAEIVNKDEDATKAMIDEAIKMLADAIDQLEDKYVEGDMQAYQQKDFDITITNDVLKTDDGSNVGKMIQQGSFDGLFNGKKGDANSRDFELKWDIDANYVDGKLPNYVSLPLTLTFNLKTSDKLNKVVVYNANKSNGYVTKIKATIYYADGSKETKEINKVQEAYTFRFEALKAASKVDITILSAVDAYDEPTTNLLTISEIELFRDGNSIAEKPVEVNKEALKATINLAKVIDTSNKTTESKAVLASAIASAEKVLADKKATQSDVDAAIEAINNAIAQLKDIEVKPEPKPEYKGYDDVDSEAWYAGMVQEATIKGLMGKDGNVGNNFNPDGKITRGMVATVIYRMAGKPQVTYTDKFVDVKGGFWYSEAIVWASEAKVVSGYANGKFGPDDSIKREDFAIMLRNYANTCGLNTKSSQSLETFKDYKAVSAYAKDAIAWCVEKGLMSGSKVGEEKYLNPSANTTRAEAAKMFVQLSNLIKK